jgi:hypothetical protein
MKKYSPFKYNLLKIIGLNDLHHWLNWHKRKEPIILVEKRRICEEYNLDYDKLRPIKWGKNNYLNQNAIWFYNDKGKSRYFGQDRGEITELGESEEQTYGIYQKSLNTTELNWITFHNLSCSLESLLVEYTDNKSETLEKVKELLRKTLTDLEV